MWLLVLLLAHDKSGEAIVRRNIFCSDCRPAPPRREPKPVRLLATLLEVRRNQKAILQAAVICQAGASCGWVEAGSRVAGTIVTTIEERRVWFDDGDWIELDALAGRKLEKVDPHAGGKLEKVDPRWLDHPEEIARTVTALPDKDGVRIVALRPGSPLLRLGLQRGDVIKAVNGCELFGLDASLACYQRLRNVRYVSVSLLRGGAPVTLDVALDRE